jgi:hypothetical protein
MLRPGDRFNIYGAGEESRRQRIPYERHRRLRSDPAKSPPDRTSELTRTKVSAGAQGYSTPQPRASRTILEPQPVAGPDLRGGSPGFTIPSRAWLQ